MIHLSFIYHMHQPYYKNLLSGEAELPWVRLHGIKDYLDMALFLDDFPDLRLTFNVVPSLLEQLEEYADGSLSDKFLRLTLADAAALTSQERDFIREHFFSVDHKHKLAIHPRYYQLFLRRHADYPFAEQDYRDLQVWFNLAWFDPRFQQGIPELRAMMKKARHFSEEDKKTIVDIQRRIIKDIIPTYRRLQDAGKMEVSVTPYFHPILPLLFSSFTAKDANPQTPLPRTIFSHPEDAIWHVEAALDFYRQRFGAEPRGMWPSEMSVAMEILPILTKARLRWIVVDEGLLWKTFPKIKRDGRLLYRPYQACVGNETITVIFRDRFLSDLIGFEYQHWRTKDAVDNFMHHLSKIHEYFAQEDCFITVALDGENAWEFYRNDGNDFLRLLYERIAETRYVKTVTVSDYLSAHPSGHRLPFLATGSWIFGDFNKWMGHPAKNKAWEALAEARSRLTPEQMQDARLMKQMHVCEGSDWFWWLGDKHRLFDELFRTHLKNFYQMISSPAPQNLNEPLDN